MVKRDSRLGVFVMILFSGVFFTSELRWWTSRLTPADTAGTVSSFVSEFIYAGIAVNFFFTSVFIVFCFFFFCVILLYSEFLTCCEEQTEFSFFVEFFAGNLCRGGQETGDFSLKHWLLEDSEASGTRALFPTERDTVLNRGILPPRSRRGEPNLLTTWMDTVHYFWSEFSIL